MALKPEVAGLFIHERLRNDSRGEFVITWGHYASCMELFLDDSCIVQTPAAKVEVRAYHANDLWETGVDVVHPHDAEMP
jgi:hypothetical protein